METDVETAILPQVGHHLGGDHVGEQGVAPQRGVFGLPKAEVGDVALGVGGDQNALVVGKQDLTARLGVLPLQIGEGHAGEVYPLRKGLVGIGGNRDTPVDPACGIRQGYSDGQILKGGREARENAAVIRGGAQGGVIGGVVMGLPRLVAETDAEERRGGGHTLHTVYDQRGDMSRGEVHRQSHVIKVAGTHKALLGSQFFDTTIVPHIGEIIKGEDGISVNFHLFFLHMAKSILTNPPNPSIIMVIKFALRSEKKEIRYDSVPIPLSPHGPGPL